jgi:hypothetical protein
LVAAPGFVDVHALRLSDRGIPCSPPLRGTASPV